MEKKPELTLKELAAYLPYGLKVKHESLGIHIINGYRTNNHGVSILTNDTHIGFIQEITPILRPLSDMTVKIAPSESYISKLGKIMGVSDLGVLQRDLSLKVVTKDQFIHMDFYCYHKAIEQLYEWHFDVFGFIDRNLAVDINSLTPSPELKTP